MYYELYIDLFFLENFIKKKKNDKKNTIYIIGG